MPGPPPVIVPNSLWNMFNAYLKFMYEVHVYILYKISSQYDNIFSILQ
jgi:hypothetical protein